MNQEDDSDPAALFHEAEYKYLHISLIKNLFSLPFTYFICICLYHILLFIFYYLN